jgi:hypothetical protein
MINVLIYLYNVDDHPDTKSTQEWRDYAAQKHEASRQ